MKLHGSTNWLLCPNCNRLYTGLGCKADVWTEYILGRACPRCKHVLSKVPATKGANMEPPTLEPFLITPTFVKKFENPHIRMVWHNAYLDLCEASRVVFIGYSLPQADYHLRTLFKRAIRPDAEIAVVLAESDEPDDGTGIEGRGGVVGRYEKFFRSSQRPSFKFTGVKGYFGDVFGPESSTERIDSLKKKVESLNAESESIE